MVGFQILQLRTSAIPTTPFRSRLHPHPTASSAITDYLNWCQQHFLHTLFLRHQFSSMTKNKNSKKKSNSKSKTKRHGVGEVGGSTVSFIDYDETNTSLSSLFWSIADECAHYAALGCHIASIARYFVPPKNDKSKGGKNKKSRVNSDSATTPYISALHASSLEHKEEMYHRAMQHHPWLLGIEHFDPSEYDPDDLLNFPEVTMNDAFDDEDDHYVEGDRTMTLAITNITQDTIKVFIVSIYDVDLCDAAGNVLKSGKASKTTVDSTAGGDIDNNVVATISIRERKCTTFIVLCPPQTYVHLCSLAPNQQEVLLPTLMSSSWMTSPSDGNKVPITSWTQVEIETVIQPWLHHPNPKDEHPYLLHFPFAPHDDRADKNDVTTKGGTAASSTTVPDYQCIQSEFGQFSHFSRRDYHSFDFACPIGTPLYSPVNGIVVAVWQGQKGHNESSSDDTTTKVTEVSGIAARNMFHCNSIMLLAVEVDDLEEADVALEVPDDDDDDDYNTAVKIEQQQRTSKDDDPLYVELFHIQSDSCVVQVGDVVTKGQLLCHSGWVGFCPEPQLHFAAYRSFNNATKDAATVRVRFECDTLTKKKNERQHKILEESGKLLQLSSNNDMCEQLERDDRISTSLKNPKNDDDDDDDEVLEVASPSFLPRVGGWYNGGGLVR